MLIRTDPFDFLTSPLSPQQRLLDNLATNLQKLIPKPPALARLL